MADFAQPRLSEFDPLRRRLQSQFSQEKSEAQSALQRRYAANGMMGSGAYQKQAQQADVDFAQKQADAQGQLDLAEGQEFQRRKEVTEGREFQTKEREGAQNFQSEFAKREREATQSFARGERESGQLFNKQLFDSDQAFKQKVFENENYWKDLEFKENKLTNYINTVLGFGDAEIDQDRLDYISGALERLGIQAPGGLKAPVQKSGGGQSHPSQGGTLNTGDLTDQDRAMLRMGRVIYKNGRAYQPGGHY